MTATPDEIFNALVEKLNELSPYKGFMAIPDYKIRYGDTVINFGFGVIDEDGNIPPEFREQLPPEVIEELEEIGDGNYADVNEDADEDDIDDIATSMAINILSDLGLLNHEMVSPQATAN